ncbi:methylated-DNA--[protein]-cysteine S-methyltransferase [Rhodoferax sp.]|uniref:methylated-DNA--[protein]-cysteine S-methyltransferase n=1 Tax=Rhodoferax sp. TaxID=50421 RepID=UPI0025E58333|nr:methylated-DNA--[protein]-cysteine S-methyltransferase [Rhodoferax sp.]MCM2342506.1 methylated-DNA--[protein]-cysteine S-methyltransferase [Rhodoferax sp.]
MKTSVNTVTTTFDSPLGLVRLAANPQGLCGVWFDGHDDSPDASHWAPDPNHALLQQATRQLGDYFAGQRRQFELPLDLSTGTPFQQSVWRALLDIPFGQTCSYGTVSAAIGKPSAVRAVGGAIGRNPLSIMVPCHRVIGANGALTGYSGGMQRKVALLQLERAL